MCNGRNKYLVSVSVEMQVLELYSWYRCMPTIHHVCFVQPRKWSAPTESIDKWYRRRHRSRFKHGPVGGLRPTGSFRPGVFLTVSTKCLIQLLAVRPPTHLVTSARIPSWLFAQHRRQAGSPAVYTCAQTRSHAPGGAPYTRTGGGVGRSRDTQTALMDALAVNTRDTLGRGLSRLAALFFFGVGRTECV